MSERMIEQRRAKLLAQTVAVPTQPNNGSSAATPRQAAAQAMRAEDAQMSRFLRLLQEQRDDGQPGETVFGPTVPTSLSRREINRQGVGFADTAVAAVVSAAADRFLASVLQQSIPCRAQRLKGIEVARQAARERKRFRQKYEQDIDERKRRNAQDAAKRNAANQAAIRQAEELENNNNTNTAKRKSESESPNDTANKKQKTSSSTSAKNGVQIEAAEIDYDSVDEEDKRYIEHYEPYEDDDDMNSAADDDDDEDDDEALFLDDIARPLRAWGFHVDGKLTSDILGSIKSAPTVNEPDTNDVTQDGPVDETQNGQIQMNGEVRNAEEADKEGKPNATNASNHGTPTKRAATPKAGETGNSTKTKSPSTTTTT